MEGLTRPDDSEAAGPSAEQGDKKLERSFYPKPVIQLADHFLCFSVQGNKEHTGQFVLFCPFERSSRKALASRDVVQTVFGDGRHRRVVGGDSDDVVVVVTGEQTQEVRR